MFIWELKFWLQEIWDLNCTFFRMNDEGRCLVSRKQRLKKINDAVNFFFIDRHRFEHRSWRHAVVLWRSFSWFCIEKLAHCTVSSLMCYGETAVMHRKNLNYSLVPPPPWTLKGRCSATPAGSPWPSAGHAVNPSCLLCAVFPVEKKVCMHA